MTILIATRNRHKVEEIKAILGAEKFYKSLADFSSSPEVIEDAPTFEGNATKKAVALANWIAGNRAGIDYVLADDSGLEVDALNGAPGVHSARFAALDSGASGNSKDADNNAKLLRLLTGVTPEERTARFRCVIAFTPVPAFNRQGSSPACAANEAEMSVELFIGSCEGNLLENQKGENGFGYDPLFVPKGFDQTFAELGESVKNRISHRSKALEQLKKRLTMLRA